MYTRKGIDIKLKIEIKNEQIQIFKFNCKSYEYPMLM